MRVCFLCAALVLVALCVGAVTSLLESSVDTNNRGRRKRRVAESRVPHEHHHEPHAPGSSRMTQALPFSKPFS